MEKLIFFKNLYYHQHYNFWNGYTSENNFHHRDPFKSFCGKYPCYAVNFLQKHHQKYLNKKLFNNYNWGGYLIHEYPEKQIFIDGRLPQKP